MVLDIEKSVNTAKMYAKQLEEELFSLMNAHNIDAIRRTGAENKIKGLYDALEEIEKAKSPPKIAVKPKPKIIVEKSERLTPVKSKETSPFNRAM